MRLAPSASPSSSVAFALLVASALAGCSSAAEADASAASQDSAATATAAASALVAFAGRGGCLDVVDGGTANGTRVQIWQCFAGNANQAWTLDGGAVRASNGKCLDVKDGVAANGAALQLWDCTGGPNQRWTLTASGELQGLGGRCLDVEDNDTANGAALQTWDCFGGPNQIWKTAGATTTAPVTTADAGSSGSPSTTPTNPKTPGSTTTVLALGDSITNGYTCAYTAGGQPYPTILGTLLGSGYAVTNGGVPGDTVSQMQSRWASTYAAQEFDRCVFMGGVNDIGRGASAADTFATASALLDQMRASGCATTVMQIMPYHADPYGYDTPDHQAQRALYNQSLAGYCSAHGVKCLSTEAVLGNGATPPALVAADSWDGIHPSAAGCTILANLAKTAF